MIDMLVSFIVLLNMSDYDTFLFVDEGVESYLTYEYSYNVRTVEELIKTRVADCTGRAMLKKAILDQYGINTRLVHGYCNQTKHDWIEVNIGGKYITNEHLFCKDLLKKGYGVW